MAPTFSLVDTWDDGKRIHVSGTVAASGNYSTGGDPLDLSQFPVIATTQAPVQGTAWVDGLACYDYDSGNAPAVVPCAKIFTLPWFIAGPGVAAITATCTNHRHPERSGRIFLPSIKQFGRSSPVSLAAYSSHFGRRHYAAIAAGSRSALLLAPTRRAATSIAEQERIAASLWQSELVQI